MSKKPEYELWIYEAHDCVKHFVVLDEKTAHKTISRELSRGENMSAMIKNSTWKQSK